MANHRDELYYHQQSWSAVSRHTSLEVAVGLVVVVALAARVAFEWQEVWDLHTNRSSFHIYI